MDFYEFIPDTLSTFSKSESIKYRNQGYKLVSIKKVKIDKLSNIIRKYRGNKKIDYMTVDTEGLDLEVLKSNDWNKYRPKLICVETLKHNRNSKKRSINKEIGIFLNKVGYSIEFDNNLNSIFIDTTNKR